MTNTWTMTTKSPVITGRRHHVFVDEETVILAAEYGRLAVHPSIIGQIRGAIREVLTARGIDCDGVIHRARKGASQ